MYVTVNYDEDGRPVEVFARLGKAGRCTACHCDALAKCVARCLQAGVDPETLVLDLVGQACDRPAITDGQKVLSCVDAMGQALRAAISKGKES